MSTVEGAVMAANRLANDSLSTLKNATLGGAGELLGQAPRLQDAPDGEQRQDKGEDEGAVDSSRGGSEKVAEEASSNGEASSAWMASPETETADKLRAFDEL